MRSVDNSRWEVVNDIKIAHLAQRYYCKQTIPPYKSLNCGHTKYEAALQHVKKLNRGACKEVK